MKSRLSLIVLFVFSLMASTVYGQELDLVIGNNYYFISNLGMESSELMKVNGRKVNATEEIRNGHIVKIVDIKEERVYFEYLNFRAKKKNKKDLGKGLVETELKSFRMIYNFENEGTKIFSLSETDFKRLTKDYYNFRRGWDYGVYTLPIRLRRQSGKFEFDANVSLGANVVLGLGNRKKDYSLFDLSFGIGITKVDLDTENSMLGNANSDFSAIEVLSPTAFTASIGALVNLGKNVNIGFYLGWDKLSSADNKATWIYNGKPWTGIGLNVSFSNEKEASSSSISTNKS